MSNLYPNNSVSPVTAKKNCDADDIFGRALADLWERDIAEITRTRQPGYKSVCRKLKQAAGEARRGGN